MSYWREGNPVQDVVMENGVPTQFTWRGQVHPIKQIANQWRIDDGWWEQRIWQDRFKIITTTGLMVILAHDLVTDIWFTVREYD
jgi:hypothetical protein